MIVLDASALADWLLRTPRLGSAVATRIASSGEMHTLDFAWTEVASVIRRKHLSGELTVERVEELLDDLDQAPLVPHSAAPFVRRIWQLRDTLTAYDAAYVTLAEALAASLVTTDGGLARAHGHLADVQLIA